MTEEILHTMTLSAPPRNMREVLRYAGCRGRDEAVERLAKECMEEAWPQLRYRACWRRFSVERSGGEIDLGFARTGSETAGRFLEGCSGGIVFAATVGLPLDRLISRYGRTSPARALMFQAIGAERIESLCDCLQQQLSAHFASEGLSLQRRFSPGYGDLPLAMQREIFQVLDCSRQLGLSLNDSLLMSPSKSVTALAGLKHGACPVGQEKCRECSKKDCNYRKDET